MFICNFNIHQGKTPFLKPCLVVMPAAERCTANLAGDCRNLNSFGCTLWCAVPSDMVPDVHMSVGHAQECSRLHNCKYV